MIKEALQYIIDIQQPRVQKIGGKDYYFCNGKPLLVEALPSCVPMEISTLTSLVDYVKACMADDFSAFGLQPKMIVHVRSETEVRLLSGLNGDMKRWEIAAVRARVPDIVLGSFISQEHFIIQMQSMFQETPDRDVVMQAAGNVENKTVANYGDDGVSQKATIRSGLASMEDVIVPNPVRLRPFRTFHEVGQQEIEFVFRMKNGADSVKCALFEADGGAWKFQAVHSIAEYLKKELACMDNVTVLA